MSDEINMTIPIPTDDDGYVLLQCEQCGTYFKATPADLKDDGVLHIFCPSCGLISENYVTEDVLELAMKMATNAVNDMIYNEFKKMERKRKKGIITFKFFRPNSSLTLRTAAISKRKAAVYLGS